MRKALYTLIFSLSLLACKKNNQTEKDIAAIPIHVEFINFYQQFFASNKEELQLLNQKYPYLFPTDANDPFWLSLIQDSDEKLLAHMADSVYGNFEPEKRAIENVYRHIKYYKPSFTIPKTFSVISGLDYEYPVIYADSLAFIALDMFLGKDSEVYSSFPKYIANNYTKEHITVSLASQILDKEFPVKNGRSFIETMIYHGKKLYLLEKVLPNTPEHIRLGIEKEKLAWSYQNEAEVWAYFIRENILYSTDKKLQNRFINTAPFSKFYYDSDADSPGGIGRWVGLKIVQAYMKNNKSSIDEMLLLDAETILKKSKYKPSK